VSRTVPCQYLGTGGVNDVERVQRENRIVRYLRETRAEVRKVVWPSRKEATRLSIIVLSVTIAMSIFLGVVDLLFSRLIGLIVR
jgi:preprotein translocase subunit SecE